MNGCYRRVTPAEVTMLRSEPLAVAPFLFPPEGVAPAVDRHVDVGGAWQALHFLLTGDPWAGGLPMANAVLGGEPIGEEELAGFGPARLLDPQAVQAVAGALRSLSADELVGRFEAAALNAAEVYPGAWTDDAETRAWLHEEYLAVRQLFEDAAAAGDGLVLYLA